MRNQLFGSGIIHMENAQGVQDDSAQQQNQSLAQLQAMNINSSLLSQSAGPNGFSALNPSVAPAGILNRPVQLPQ